MITCWSTTMPCNSRLRMKVHKARADRFWMTMVDLLSSGIRGIAESSRGTLLIRICERTIREDRFTMTLCTRHRSRTSPTRSRGWIYRKAQELQMGRFQLFRRVEALTTNNIKGIQMKSSHLVKSLCRFKTWGSQTRATCQQPECSHKQLPTHSTSSSMSLATLSSSRNPTSIWRKRCLQTKVEQTSTRILKSSMISWSKIHQISINWRKYIQRTIWNQSILGLNRIGSIQRLAICLRSEMMLVWRTKMQAEIEMKRGQCRCMRWKRGRGLYLGIRRPIRILI